MAARIIDPFHAIHEVYMSTIFVNSYAHGGANWWESGGASGAVAVYQPKGATSLAASYIDLSGNGNNATPVAAPAWNALTGWAFSGAQYLSTVTVSQTYTTIVQISDAAVGTYCVFGYYSIPFAHRILPNRTTIGVMYAATAKAPGVAAGNLALAGSNGYRNGALDIAVPTVGTGSGQLYIGAQRDATSGNNATALYIGKIQAIAIYNNTLDAAKVAAVAAAMAAL